MIIVPVIALYDKEKQKFLLSKRLSHKNYGGYYEFPGGKCEADETTQQALVREIKEELDINLKEEALTPITFINVFDGGKSYLLLMYYCEEFSGTPIGNEGQLLEYVSPHELLTYKMPPHNAQMIEALNLFVSLKK